MSFVFNQAAANQISKELYTDKDVESIFLVSPGVGLCPKWDQGGGLDYVGSIGNAIATSHSSQDTIAFTSGNADSYQRWTMSWMEDFQSVNMSGRAIDQTRNTEGAMVKEITRAMDNGYRSLGQGMGWRFYGDGGGALGLCNGTFSTKYVTNDTITLTNVSSAMFFQQGMIVNSSVDAGNLGLGNAGARSGSAVLVAVDKIKGTLTASAAWTSLIPQFTDADYLFNQGDYANYMPGLAGWIPDANYTISSTDSFNGVNRSIDPQGLAGYNINGNGAPMEETFIDGVTNLHAFGGRPTHCLIAPRLFAKLSKSLTGRVEYMTEEAFANPDVGFPTVQIQTPTGPMKLVQDVFCVGPKYDRCYLVNFEEMVLPSMGPLAKNMSEELTGLIWIPQTASNSFISQLGSRHTMYIQAPNHFASLLF